MLTPSFDPVLQWQLARHYWRNLLLLDIVISNLESLIWEREFLKRNHNVKDTEEAIHWPGYADPNARIRNELLRQRNVLADICQVSHRMIHDTSPRALGYYHSLAFGGYVRIVRGGQDEPLGFQIEGF